MTKLEWDKVGERRYETGVDHAVLYSPDNTGAYTLGVPWNGIVSINEAPSGAESNKQYADNIQYLNLISAEEFSATIEAFTYPDEFEEHDGTASLAVGVSVGQQRRKPFGLAYRTLIGNDVDGTDYGYKLKLVYGALAAPTEKSNNTVNDSPEAITFSWECSTTPVAVPGMKPTAILTINSTLVNAAKLAELEDILYGTAGTDARLPLPAEIMALFAGTTAEVLPVKPTQVGNVVTIPTVTGVTYYIDNEIVTGANTITEDVVVVARPNSGFKFPPVSDSDWYFEHS